jgi:hypothetical protein
MNRGKKYIALDLGGSGRCVVGSFSGDTLTLNEISRFENSYVRVLDQVFWSAVNLFGGIKQSLRRVNQLVEPADLASGGCWAQKFRNPFSPMRPALPTLPTKAAQTTKSAWSTTTSTCGCCRNAGAYGPIRGRRSIGMTW